MENIGSFLKANLDAAKESINGKRVAAYRDAEEALFLPDSTCTHLGCELEYNKAERSFDCPVHGCTSWPNYKKQKNNNGAARSIKLVLIGRALLVILKSSTPGKLSYSKIQSAV